MTLKNKVWSYEPKKIVWSYDLKKKNDLMTLKNDLLWPYDLFMTFKKVIKRSRKRFDLMTFKKNIWPKDLKKEGFILWP